MKLKSEIFSLVLLLLFVARGSAEEIPKLIRFGEVGSTSVKSIGGKPSGIGLVTLALERGFFEEEFGPGGPKIEQIYFTGSGPAQNEALAQGEIEFGNY